jgi:hypothetical protein
MDGFFKKPLGPSLSPAFGLGNLAYPFANSDGLVKSPSAALHLRALHLELFTKPSFRWLFTSSATLTFEETQRRKISVGSPRSQEQRRPAKE